MSSESTNCASEDWKGNIGKILKHRMVLRPSDCTSLFKGSTFFFTGTFKRFKREEIAYMIKHGGGSVSSSFDSEISHLIAGNSPDIEKCSQAQARGIFMATELFFLRYFIYKNVELKKIDVMKLLKKIRTSSGNSSLPPVDSALVQKKIKSKVKNKEFVFVGNLSSFEQDERLLLVKYYGGKVRDKVSFFTDYIVVGNVPSGTTHPKAKIAFTRKISEPGFIKIFNPEIADTPNKRPRHYKASRSSESSFAITGAFEKVSREDIIFLLKELGWKKECTSPPADLLIVGSNPNEDILENFKGVEDVYDESTFMKNCCYINLEHSVFTAIKEYNKDH